MADPKTPYYATNPADKLEVHQRAYQFAEDLWSREHWERRTRAEAALFLYQGNTRLTLSGGSSSFLDPLDETPPYFNLIQTATDYFTSMMCRNRIRPYFLSEGGDVDVQSRTKAYQDAVEGTMQSLGIYGALGRLRTKDGFLFDAGGIKYGIDYENKRIIRSRVRPWECCVPMREARQGEPHNLLHGQLIERTVLANMFPEDSEERQAVMDLEVEDYDNREYVVGDTSDMVRIYELWHLPSTRVDLSDPAVFGGEEDDEGNAVPPGHDGRHIIVTKAGVLLDEPWPYDYFPISWFKPNRDPVGYWSRSVPETLAGAQLEIIDLNDKEKRILDAHAYPKLILWRNSQIDPNTWDNDPRSILMSRVPPQQAAYHVVPQAVPGDLLRKKDETTRQAEKQLGVTDTALAGQKPKGVDHAPGMEHLAEMEMIRHTVAYQEYEDTHVMDARIIADMLRMLALYLEQQDEDMSVVFEKDKNLVRIKWSEMALRSDQYQIKIWPTDMFAATPTARLRQVKEAFSMGLFDGSPQSRLMARALNAPDVDSLMGDQSAVNDAVATLLQKCLDGEPDAEWIPTPEMDLELCKSESAKLIARLTADDADEEKIDRVRHFQELTIELINRATPPPAPPQAPAIPQGMPTPMGPGMAPAPAGGVPIQPV